MGGNSSSGRKSPSPEKHSQMPGLMGCWARFQEPQDREDLQEVFQVQALLRAGLGAPWSPGESVMWFISVPMSHTRRLKAQSSHVTCPGSPSWNRNAGTPRQRPPLPHAVWGTAVLPTAAGCRTLRQPQDGALPSSPAELCQAGTGLHTASWRKRGVGQVH